MMNCDSLKVLKVFFCAQDFIQQKKAKSKSMGQNNLTTK